MLSPTPSRPEGSIPLHVLTGFLGSGKTAVLRTLLDRSTRRIAVMVNEVGELGIDHHLLERVDEDILALAGGCICCSMRGEVHAALQRVQALSPDVIVLETTGLADPAPLLHGIGSDPELAAGLHLAGVTAVIDCLRAEELANSQPEVRRQIDFADRLVLSKSDLAPLRVDDVREWLAREAPGREVRVAVHGDIDPEWLLATTGFGGLDNGGAHGWLQRFAPAPNPSGEGAIDGHLAFTTHAMRHASPVIVDALQLWMSLVTQLDGHRLLRIKAIVRCAETGAGYALQAAGHAVSPPLRLRVVPAHLSGAEFVLIERGMPAAAMARLLGSLREALAAARR
jgi:G3E family GTPase